MKRLSWCALLTLLVLGTVAPAAAGDKGLTNSETFSGFQFNFNNPGARALGMGGAFVAVADDATAAVANPAGLVILQRPELSGEVKFTRFTNTVEAFTNSPAEGAANRFHARDFHDEVVTPSFFSFVYPTERLVVAAFIRELINYKSTFDTEGVFFADPAGGVVRLFPVKSQLEIQALNFGLATGLNLEKAHPLLPNIGGSIEFSVGRIRSRLERFDFTGASVSTETIDGTDLGIGFNIGALWHPVKDMGVGVVYRRGPRYDVHQTFAAVGGGSAVEDFGFKVPDVSAVGVSYRFFERLTVAFEASYIQYSQLARNFHLPAALGTDAIATKYRVDDAIELHVGAEYIFFVRDIPLAARAGFYTNPDHKIRYTGSPRNASEAADKVLYQGGKDRYHGTAGLGIVPVPGFQLDFAGNYSADIREFSVSTVFRF
jgi:long-subunit fatty acid transport protein